MKNTYRLKFYVKKQYNELQKYYEKELDQSESFRWLSDNKNRILNICASLIKSIPQINLPAGYKEIRVLELARELCLQTLANINEEAVSILKKFNLTNDEYDFLPIALKISLLDMVIKMLRDGEAIENAPSAVRSLILFNELDFDELRPICLEQENLLLSDKIYQMSDSDTRARYRKAISELSRKSGKSEKEVTEIASLNGSITESLFNEENQLFLNCLGLIKNKNHRFILYVALTLIPTVFLCALWWLLPSKMLLKLLLSIFSFAPFAVFVNNIVNRKILSMVPPQKPMRLKREYCDTPENKTAVVLTVLLASVKDVQKATKTLEEYFLGNRLDNGVYLILADLKESDKQILDEDALLIQEFENSINGLNEKYGDVFGGIVRGRQKNESFGGWERKRGAIEQLVKYITKKEDIFGTLINEKIVDNVKYICTLDADTVVPPDSIIKLLGVISHPVNKGKGLVQPAIGTVPENTTFFQKILAPVGGIDAYSTPLGEVYNDYLNSGTFCGKGVFDVKAYDEKIKIQPNTVLSHDLLEGEFLNAQGVNDVSFLDEFPKTPIAYFKRKERWLRGDWILFPYLFSSLKPLSKWKIFYNLLQAKFYKDIFLMTLIASFFGVYAYLIWLVCLVILSMPTIFAYCDTLRFSMEKHAFYDNKENRHNSIKRSVLNKLFLPFEFYIGFSAMAKGLWRRLVSHKKILEWNTFASVNKTDSSKENFMFFLPSLVLAVAFYGLCVYNGIGIIIGLIASVLWCATPFFARTLGQNEKQNTVRLLPDEIHNLKILSMRTLRFFYEALEDNEYLMPDNLQLKPYKGYAQRTSPTNLGFALLSVPCGLKTGAYSPSFCLLNLKNQIDAINKLDTFKGHLYNWYDISQKKPLNDYVSAVDSGNYCASLITVKGSLMNIRKSFILGKTQCSGIGDLIYSYLDSLNDDFKNYLEEYANDFYNLSGKKAVVRAREFLNDGIINSVEGIGFARTLIKHWLDDYNGLTFSKGLFAKIDETEEFNFRPLKDFLNTFPKPLDEILAINDFDCRLEELVWSIGKERYGKLLKEVRNEFRRIYNYAYTLSCKIKEIETYIDDFIENIDFKSLYNPKKKLLAIGMDKKGKSLNCYDMLISEARLTSFIAIATGKIPAEHWFSLSRPFTRVMEMPLCLSWSGTMFEYLMPDIFIKPTENSMLSTSNKIAVTAQIDFSGKNGLWGISESAFKEFDLSREYKYKALGVPKIKISAEKSEKVFSPYSTLLAFEYAPRECMDNMVRFVENGCAGIFGMFEAFDTKRNGIVYSHMAHHSGMGLTALINFLYDGAIRKMFLSNSFVSAAKVLLEEKMPLGVLPRKELKEADQPEFIVETSFNREYMMPDKQSSETLVLSGDEMRAEITSKGEVMLFKGNVFLGEAFLYLKDKKINSISYLPVKEDAKYKTLFYPEKAEFSYTDGQISAKAEIFFLENSREFLWRVKVRSEKETLTNINAVLVIKPALCDYQGYLAHPYFNGLFIENQREDNGIIIKNRKTDQQMHLCALNEGKVSFETDAMRVLGRGNDFSRPLLDFDNFKKYPITPILSCGAEMTLESNDELSVDFLFSENPTLLKNKAAVNLATENAKNTANADISAFALKKEEWLFSLKIAALKNAGYRLEKGEAKAETLWQYGISDSVPLMTVIIPRDFSKEKLKFVLKSADHLMSKGFSMQVIIIEDTIGDYLDGNFNYTDREIRSLISKDKIYHIKRNGLSDDKLREIIALSFVKIDIDGDINEQIKKVKPYISVETVKSGENKYPIGRNEDFDGEFDNGFGKFINDGKEYFIYKKTPAPWSNVISNENFGTLITENGGGYSWQGNSALNKLSPWYNDAVINPLGEALYLRDDKINRFWSITRDPVDMGDEHSVVFGKGYGIFRYNGFGMNQKQTVFVHKEKAIKIIKIDIENLRDATAYYFIKPVMNEKVFDAHKYIEIVQTDGMLCAKRNNEYMFIYAKNSEYCDNEESFFGNGGLRNPDALRTGEFIKTEYGRQLLALKTKAKESFCIFMGYAKSEEELKSLKQEIDNADVEQWLDDIKNHWDELSGRVQIKTPERKLDILFNNWLYYQSISSRFQAKCGFYQAGGAWGFRDQLQDCLAMIISQPEKVRNHILKCASHQFKEGDVQHWWHEPFLGVRTRVSDDLLFLPYVASQYVKMTGDKDILNEEVFFLEGHSLTDRDDLYENAWQSEEKATLSEHCLRAIKLAISRSGQHGLPLILGGDWNDGMNNLGKKGKGESVWLGWFLYTVISDFLPFAQKDKEFLINHAKKLYNALNTVCWDGEWYLRAFDDENRKIGSHLSECAQIDAISQAWSVLSGAGKMNETAMESVEKHLIDYEKGIVKLLTPPFFKEYGAGYIGDYIPGVRENGGQYTHGALWVARAFLEMGKSEKGFEILDMINPISHSTNKNSALRYKLEPYSVAADIYSNEENSGRGGWSWYTASSALYFNTVLFGLLGINIENKNVSVSPHIPPSWREFFVKIDTPEYKYDIKVLNPSARSDGAESVTEIKKDDKTEIRVVM